MADPVGRAPAESQSSHRLAREPLIDPGGIMTLADPAWPGGEFRLMSHHESVSLLPAVSVEVDGVDARVRWFFGRDPDGNVVNVLSRR